MKTQNITVDELKEIIDYCVERFENHSADALGATVAVVTEYIRATAYDVPEANTHAIGFTMDSYEDYDD